MLSKTPEHDHAGPRGEAAHERHLGELQQERAKNAECQHLLAQCQRRIAELEAELAEKSRLLAIGEDTVVRLLAQRKLTGATSSWRIHAGPLSPASAERERDAAGKVESAACKKFFDLMLPETRDECISLSKVCAYEDGDIVCEQGSIGSTLYFVDAGEVTVEMQGRQVGVVGQGEFVGEAFLATVRSLLLENTRDPAIKERLQTAGLQAHDVLRTTKVQAQGQCRLLELHVKDIFVVFKDDHARLAAVIGPGQGNTMWKSDALAPGMGNQASAEDSRGSQRKPSMIEEIAAEAAHSDNLAHFGFLRHYASSDLNIGLFDSMADATRMACFARMTRRKYKAGDVIVKQGTKGETLYVVEDGTAAAVHMGCTLRSFEKASVFGEIAFAASIKEAMCLGSVEPGDVLRLCDVVASTNCVCWELGLQCFVEVVLKDLKRNRASLKWLSAVSRERRAEARQQGLVAYGRDPSGLTLAYDSTDTEGEEEGEEEDGFDCESDEVEEEKAYSQRIRDMEEGVEFGRLWPLIPGRLAFTIHVDEGQSRREILTKRDIYFFSSELHEEYEPYCDDFGPVNLATVYNFCAFMTGKMLDTRLATRKLCYYAEKDISLRTNAAFLLGAFLMLTQGYSPEMAIEPFYAMGPCAFLPYRDATHRRPPTFYLTLLDCFKGLERAVAAAWFDPRKFDVHRYISMDDPDGASLNQLCPKFVAFRGPDVRDQNLRRPEFFFRIFKRLGVTDVIRLNDVETYDRSSFVENGFQHHDLQFEDCTTPPPLIVRKFMKIVEKSKGLVAVHCLAGLGRTGTLVALWIMINKGWSARECIAWLRIARPGCVIGSQQQYLEVCQDAITKGLPFPEPEITEETRRNQIAKEVQRGMLERAERRKSSGGSNRGMEDASGDVGITPAEASLIAKLENSSRPKYTGDRADIQRYTKSTNLVGILTNSPR